MFKKKNRHKTTLKNIILIVSLLFFLAIPQKQAQAQAPAPAGLITTAPVDTMIKTTKDERNWITKAIDKIKKDWKELAFGEIVLSTLDSYSQKMAQQIATGLATAAKGGKSLAWGDIKTYSDNATDAAAGNFIEDMSKGMGWEGLCQPNIGFKLKLTLALFDAEKPRTPKCTASALVKNWKKTLSNKDGALLKKFSATFDTKQNDLGIWLDMNDRLAKKKQKEKDIADRKRAEEATTTGLKAKKSTISNDTKTPAQDFATMRKAQIKEAAGKKKDDSAIIAAAKSTWAKTWLISKRFVNTFAKTLWNESVKDMFKGTYTLDDTKDFWKKFCKDNFSVCKTDKDGKNIGPPKGGDNGLNNPNSQQITLSKKQAEIKFSKKYVFGSVKTDASNLFVLPDFSNCPQDRQPGPNNCIVDSNFVNAISNKQTLQEAIADGTIDGNKIFGFHKKGKITMDNGYPYRSILVLRKYRIVPVGWELAAEYIDKFGYQNETLNSLIEAYDDKSSPFYRLIDPKWVLKIPSIQCQKMGPGPEIISTIVNKGVDIDGQPPTEWSDPGDIPPSLSITRNDQYCADEKSCIKEDSSGSCAFHGYCMEEKRTYKIEGEGCENINNTCQAYVAPEGNVVSYLKNSLEWSNCNSQNAGCTNLCTDFNPAENDLLTSEALGHWGLDDIDENGLVTDYTSNNNHGTPKGSASLPTRSEGKINNSFNFQRSDQQHVEIPNSSLFNFGNGTVDSPFTISVWIRTDNHLNTQTIVSKYGSGKTQYQMYLEGQDVTFGVYQNSPSAILRIASNTDFLLSNRWYHLTGTYDGSSNINGLQLYINGIKQTDITQNLSGTYTAIQETSQPIMIGLAGSLSVPIDPFGGKIDDVTIYDRALSEKEIWNKYMSYDCLDRGEDVYLSIKAPLCDQEEAGCGNYLESINSLVAFWQFEKGSEDIAYDSSGNQNKATLINFPTDPTDNSQWITGQSGISLQFDGVDDFLSAEAIAEISSNNSKSVSLWAKFNQLDGVNNDYLFDIPGLVGSTCDGFTISQQGDKIQADMNGCGSINGATTLTQDQWHHIVITYNKKNSYINIYIDGVLDASTQTESLLNTAKQTFYIGGSNTTPKMNGQIDEVSIFNQVLNLEEVQQIFNNGLNFNAKNIKVANKNLHCYGRTAGDAIFDIPSNESSCFSIGDRFDTNLGEGGCFEYLYHKNKADCENNLGTWLNSPIKVTRHTNQSYCTISGGVWNTVLSICETSCLKIDEPECSNYAFNCKAVENGCEKYTPTNGGTPIPGVTKKDDYCPQECAGYDTYKQEATNFESSIFPTYFIPNTAVECSPAVAGCDEFTNIDDASEALQYYSYMRQCEPTPTVSATYQCGTFYTWIDAGFSGYKLQSNFLKSTGVGATEDPIEILRIEEDLGPCNNANDALTNENCKEFYNGDGIISYHLLKKTISCSNECTKYRKTVPSNFDIAQTCKNIGGTWTSPTCTVNNEQACKNTNGTWTTPNCIVTIDEPSASCVGAGGSWNGLTSKCESTNTIIEKTFCSDSYFLDAFWDTTTTPNTCTKNRYKAIPAEGLSCTAEENGCREYTGNTGGNVMTVVNDTFENSSYLYDFPDSGNGWTNISISSVSTTKNQHSIKVDNGTTQKIDKWLFAKCNLPSTCLQSTGCSCDESQIATVFAGDGDTNTTEEVCTVGIDQDSCTIANHTYNGGAYILSFWAKGNLNNTIEINAIDHLTSTNTINFGSADLEEDWKRYTFGPITIDTTGWSEDYKLEFKNIKSNGGLDDSKFSTYIDNVKIEAITDSVFKIKNSWNTPASCDQDPDGNSYLYYMLGCDEYFDTQNNTSFLKSFTNICKNEAVGCKKYIDTHNSSAAYAKTWNEGDPSEIIVPEDSIVYLAQTSDYSCNTKGCESVGYSEYSQDKSIITQINESYRINNPDEYITTLCKKEDVGCQTFYAGDNEYFKDPEETVCEYVKPSTLNRYDWYKKDIDKKYDKNSEKCPTDTYQNLGIKYPSGECVGGTKHGKPCLLGTQTEDECTGGNGTCVNWTGTCPTNQSGCTTLIDPLSDFNSEIINNSNFRKNLDKDGDGDGDGTDDGLPDGWNGVLSSYNQDGFIDVNNNTFTYLTPIPLNTSSAYRLMTEIKKIPASTSDVNLKITCNYFNKSNSSCPSKTDTGFYPIDRTGQTKDSCGLGINNEITLTVPNSTLTDKIQRFSIGFSAGSCINAKIEIDTTDTTPQTVYTVSLKEVNTYNYIDSSMGDAKTECTQVDSDTGCILLNNRNNIELKESDYLSHLNYSADSQTTDPTICNFGESTFGCNADTLIKATPDRDCGKWLYCNRAEIIDGKDYCTDRGVCDVMDKNGTCIHTPLDYSDPTTLRNMTFDQSSVDKIKNLSGYSNIGFDWDPANPGQKIIEGTLSPAQISFHGESAGLLNGNFEDTTQKITNELSIKGTCSWDPKINCINKCWNTPSALCIALDPTSTFTEIKAARGDLCPNEDISLSKGVCIKTDIRAAHPTHWSTSATFDNLGYGLINNPIQAQEKGVTIYEGKNIMFVNAGSNGSNHPLQGTLTVSPGTEYILTGYINTKKLSSSQALSYGTITVEYPFGAAPAITYKKITATLTKNRDWTMVQSVFTPDRFGSATITLGDNNLKPVPPKIVLDGNTITCNDCTEPCLNCSGQLFFDNITIKPSLIKQYENTAGIAPNTNISVNTYATPSCKLYPEQDSLSCEYLNPENNYYYKGTEGYCLETDPDYPEYCLNWYPIDTAYNDSNLLEPAGYDGPAPLYYCVEESRSIECAYNDVTDSFESPNKITYCNKLVKVVDEAGNNQSWAERIKINNGYTIDPTGPTSTGLNYTYGNVGPIYGAISEPTDPTEWTNRYDGNIHAYAPYHCVETPGSCTINNDSPQTSYTTLVPTTEIADKPLQPAKTDGSASCSVGKATCTAKDRDYYNIPLAAFSTPHYGIFKKKYDSCKILTAGCTGLSFTAVGSSPYNDPGEHATNGGITYDGTGCGTTVYIRCDHKVNASNPCSISPSPNRVDNIPNIPPSPRGVEEIKRLFSKTYGGWRWNGTKYVSNITLSWDYSTASCPGSTRPPVNYDTVNDICGIQPDIMDIKINDSGLTATIISDQEFTLKFNSKVDTQQLPLVDYLVDWSDGTKPSGKKGVAVKDKNLGSPPHTFKNRYNLASLKAKALTGTFPKITCLSPNCTVTPTITIKDNWEQTITVNAPSIIVTP